jgi:methylaspartate ammonia-lyase
MFATFMTRWKACDNVAVNVHITPTSALQWTVTDVRQAGGILSAVVLSGAGGDQPAFPTEHAVGLSGDCIVDVDVAVTDALPARRVPTTRAVDLVAMILENIRRTR